MSSVPPLVVIVGPTASGKTDLAIQLARRFNGEIICADSRTVYRGLDLGTAKPTPKEQSLVPHHLLDVVTPDQSFTVADFQKLALKTINDIAARGSLPIMVGGSGLYIDALLYNYEFSAQDAPRDPVNPRHKRVDARGGRSTLRSNTLVLGLDLDSAMLKQKIRDRVDYMVEQGLTQEAQWLLETYPGSKAADSTGYKAVAAYLNGSATLEEAKKLFVYNDWQLARRQRTWFKRNKSIHWVGDFRNAVELVTTLLNKKQ